MNPQDLQQIETQHSLAKLSVTSAVVDVGLRVLGERATLMLALLLVAGMFGAAMALGGWDRLGIAGAFAVGVWCILNLKPQGGQS